MRQGGSEKAKDFRGTCQTLQLLRGVQASEGSGIDSVSEVMKMYIFRRAYIPYPPYRTASTQPIQQFGCKYRDLYRHRKTVHQCT